MGHIFFIVFICIFGSFTLWSQTYPSSWQRFEVDSPIFNQFLNGSNCRQSIKKFTGCLFALDQMARDHNLKFILSRTHTEKLTKIFRLHLIDITDMNFPSKWLELQNENKELHKNLLPAFYDEAKLEKDFLGPYLSILPLMSAFNMARAYNRYLSYSDDPHAYLGVNSRHFIYSPDVKVKQSNGRWFIDFIPYLSPFYGQNIHKGDELIEINGERVNSLTVEDFYSLWRQETPRLMRLNIQTGSVVKEIFINPVAQKNVEYTFISGEYHYYSLRDISPETYTFMENSLKGLDKLDYKYIIDLRDNSGGDLLSAQRIAKLFGLKNTEIAYQPFDSEEFKVSIDETITMVKDVKILILVNSQTASAAEALAGLLSMNSMSVLIGERTYGKGVYQVSQNIDISQQLLLWRSQGLYKLPKWGIIQSEGIDVDINFSESQSLTMREEDYFYAVINPEGIQLKLKKQSYKIERLIEREELIKCFSKKNISDREYVYPGDPLMQAVLAASSCFNKAFSGDKDE